MFRRPIKLPRIRLKKAGLRTTVTLPGNALSYTHMEESRSVGFDAPAQNPSRISSARFAKDWRELLWLGLVMSAIAAAAAAQVMK
jgi:hypothetical protein